MSLPLVTLRAEPGTDVNATVTYSMLLRLSDSFSRTYGSVLQEAIVRLL